MAESAELPTETGYPLITGTDRLVRERFYDRYSEALRRIADSAPTSAVAAALAESDEISGLAGVLAQAFDLPAAKDPLGRARARAVAAKKALLEKAGGTIEASEVAALLEISPQAIHQRRNRGTLLALQRPNGQWVFPAFQFEPPELASQMGEVLSAFAVKDPVVQLSILLNPAPSLGGITPMDALRAGDVEGAREAVAGFGVVDDAGADIQG